LKKKRCVERYTHFERADMVKLARWDAEQTPGARCGARAECGCRRYPTVASVRIGSSRTGWITQRVEVG